MIYFLWVLVATAILNVIAMAVMNMRLRDRLGDMGRENARLQALGSGNAYREMVESRDKAYVERNHAVIALAHMALAAGFKAGRGIDTTAPPTWDPPYLRVVYVELPDNQQVSWHMGPGVDRAWEDLPEYLGTWDGTYLGRVPEWPTKVVWRDAYKDMVEEVYARAEAKGGVIENGRIYRSPPELGMPYGTGQK